MTTILTGDEESDMVTTIQDAKAGPNLVLEEVLSTLWL